MIFGRNLSGLLASWLWPNQNQNQRLAPVKISIRCRDRRASSVSTETGWWLFTHISASEDVTNAAREKQTGIFSLLIPQLETLKDKNIVKIKNKWVLNFWSHYIFNVTHFFQHTLNCTFSSFNKKQKRKTVQHISKTQNNNRLHVKI